jgi:hypothetical protein
VNIGDDKWKINFEEDETGERQVKAIRKSKKEKKTFVKTKTDQKT